MSGDPAMDVTPFTGVWIETTIDNENPVPLNVTPFTGVWIETLHPPDYQQPQQVTPFTGVWIETIRELFFTFNFSSLPSRECGLKHVRDGQSIPLPCHSLHGSVD